MPASERTHETIGDMDRRVLVLGGTGQQGGAVICALKARNRPVRAMVRNPDTAAAKTLVSLGVEVVRGDLSDPASLRFAMAGMAGVFSIQPNSGNQNAQLTDAEEVRYGKAVADIAVETGVDQLVYTSASIIRGGPTGVANLDCKLEIEDHIRALPISSTIVRPATFMELLMLPAFGLAQRNMSFFLQPHEAAEFIAVDDIGNIVAQIFEDRTRFAGRTIEIAGDEITGADLQREISATAGKPIGYQRFPESLLGKHEALRKTTRLFGDGRAKDNADMAALTDEFGHLMRFREWLSKAGGPLVREALAAGGN
ncbi:NmrA/HSCARG family protein [Aliihoeflea sp. PC F10.4]